MMKVDVGSIGCHAKLVFLFLLSYSWCDVGHCHKSPLAVVNPLDIVSEKIFFGSCLNYHELLQLTELPSKFLKKNSPISSITSNLNSSCSESLKQIGSALFSNSSQTKTYAHQIVDSWAKPESGILDGNIIWEGRYYECHSATDGKNGSGQYCKVVFAINSTLPIGKLPPSETSIAGCFPNTCTSDEIYTLVTSVITNQTVKEIVCISPEISWEGKDIFGIFIVCFFGLLVVLSTIYDILRSPCPSVEVQHDQVQSAVMNQVPTTFQRAMLSFSVIQNTKRLLDTSQRPTDITCLHGMRFLSMTWVILGHSFIFIVTNSDNSRAIARYFVNHYEAQAIINAFYSVDSFFFLSGLLVVYLGLRQLNKRHGNMNVPLMYFYRYVRLTPPYALLMLFSVTLWPKLGDGPFWWTATVPSIITPCQKYWYTNLLYINNLYPSTLQEECWSWGWYLANDTQFYLLAPLFLWFLHRYPKVGLSLISFVLLSSVTITGAFSSYTKQQPIGLGFGLIAKAVADPHTPLFSAAISESSNSNGTKQTYSVYISDLYGKPWCRIGAYLVGMITGYILVEFNNKIHMKKITVLVGWTLAFIVNYLLVYCSYPAYSKGIPWSVNLAAFYNAISRPMWCVGLAWVTIACVSGYGGPINRLLSWKAFIPLSRLTYCSYLIHPLVLGWFVGTNEVQAHFSVYFVVMLFLFVVVLTTMCAYVVAMLIEFPVIELMKILQTNISSKPPAAVSEGSSDQNSLLTNNS